ncbi:HIPL1 protein isoform X1 [Helianthus annuus]|uniref:HIPL1 protein isoform X1 n=1 Tax=Helianthus annuus TaxID=4232 RepID=UPI000B8F81F1|nr:HIPL1 protein isoform X1 [Helianthus annuus]
MLFDDYYVLARTTDEAKDVLAQPLPHKRSVSLRDSAASSFHDMMKMNILLLSVTLFLLLINPALSLPLCIDLSAPVTHKTPPTFCNYNGSSRCDSTDNSNIRKQFESMNVSQPACASVLKSILCSKERGIMVIPHRLPLSDGDVVADRTTSIRDGMVVR